MVTRMNNLEFQVALPIRVGSPRSHSHRDDGIYGSFESIIGSRLWELSEIPMPLDHDQPLRKELTDDPR